MNVWEVIASICAGLAVCIPLVVKLVETVRESVKKGNWNKIVGMVAKLMAEAETQIADGATRKEWVIGMVRANAAELEYDLSEADWAKISDMIDALCAMAKTVNGVETETYTVEVPVDVREQLAWQTANTASAEETKA